MTYEQFKKEIEQNILSYVKNAETAEICTIHEINGSREGLLIKAQEEDTVTVFYLEEYFHQHILKGETLKETLHNIAEEYQSHRKKTAILPISPEEIKKELSDKLWVKLINYEKNKEWLEELPHEKVLDLAVIPCLDLENGDHVTVRKEMAEMLGLKEEELLHLAKENNSHYQKPKICYLEEMLAEITGIPMEKELGHSMLVLTGENKYFGASLLLDQKLMEEVSKAMGGDYFLLPSSVHELLFFPDDGNFRAEELEQIVREVNRTEVAPEEFLSDLVYRYDAAEKKLTLAEPEKEKKMQREIGKKLEKKLRI